MGSSPTSMRDRLRRRFSGLLARVTQTSDNTTSRFRVVRAGRVAGG
jgi:hypothetical protein